MAPQMTMPPQMMAMAPQMSMLTTPPQMTPQIWGAMAIICGGVVSQGIKLPCMLAQEAATKIL